jgi:hypothetical protein
MEEILGLDLYLMADNRRLAESLLEEDDCPFPNLIYDLGSLDVKLHRQYFNLKVSLVEAGSLVRNQLKAQLRGEMPLARLPNMKLIRRQYKRLHNALGGDPVLDVEVPKMIDWLERCNDYLVKSAIG